MTCRSCERRIKREVGRLPNVQRVSASAVRGRVEVFATGPVAASALHAAIEAAGYSVGRTSWFSRDSGVWLTAGAGILLVAALAVAAQVTGVTELAKGTGDIREGGLVVALLLGLAAGVSTCLALTGGLVLALSAAFAAGRNPGAGGEVLARLRPSAVFVAGRIVGFAVLGGLLGAIGASIALPPIAVAVLMVSVAVLMTLLGIRLTGLSPRVAGWSPTLPMGLGRSLGMDEGTLSAYSDTRAMALGVATFFLPCGFTQAVQVYALSTGSPLVAGAIMAVFAIGTAPGLLALAGLPALIPGGARPAFTRVVGVVVLGFALVNGAAGLRLLGVSPEIGLTGRPVAAPEVTFDGGIQVLRTAQLASGYVPQDAALYAGVPTRWIVDSREGGSCATFLQVPSLGLAVTLHPGENAIDLPPLKPGRIAYSCSMGMYGASLTAVEPPTGALQGLPRS
jgi:sulfite exporter TauE/SafE/copper chaperone CopZ